MKKFILSGLLFSQMFIIIAQPTDSILIAYFPFNGNAIDESGNGNNGTVYGATLSADRFDSIVGSAYNFDGIDDYIEIGALPELTNSFNSFSVSFWIKSGSDVYEWVSLMRNVNNDAAGGSFGLDFHRNGTQFQFGKISFATSDKNNKFLTFGVIVPEIFNNKWHHLVCNFEDISNNKASVYIDGEQVNVEYYTTNGPTNYSLFDNPWVLGAGNSRGNIETYYKGSLDDFRICDQILSENIIDSLYHIGGWPVKGDSLITDNLIAYYPFNGNANDESGNGNNGTINGATLTADRFDSLKGSAYYFDGIDDYIEIGTLPELAYNFDSFSFSFWINSGSDVSQWCRVIGSVNNTSNGMAFGLDFHNYGSQFLFGILTLVIRCNDNKYFTFAVYASEIFNNKWHHIVYNFEDIGNNKVSVYIDGRKTDITYNNTEGPKVYGLFDNPWAIGAGNNRGVIEKFYKGSIDDFRIYGCSLSVDEIDSLYHEKGFIDIPAELKHISCFGETDGSIKLTTPDSIDSYRFNWSNGDSTSFIDSLAAGEFSVIITDTNDIRLRFETFLITEPLPITIGSLNNNTITCYGYNTGEINATASGGTGNLIYALKDSISYQGNGYFSGLYAGDYIISIMDENECIIDSDTITLVQNDKLPVLDIIGSTEVEEYEQVTYSVNLITGSQYEWITNGGNILNGQGTNVVIIHWGNSAFGKIGVIESTNQGCKGDTAWLSVSIGGNFIDQIKKNTLKIFPNPMTEQTTIQFPNPGNQQFKLCIFNSGGQAVLIIDNICSDKVVIDNNYLIKGYYYIEVSGPELFRGKLLVQ